MTHSFVFLLFELSLVLGAAKIGGLVAQKMRQPIVLGELLAGIVSKPETLDRWTVACGMVPRGEVGLIFAGMGASLKVGGVPLLDPILYAAVILMVFITTAITPPLLAPRLKSL
jgi:Kef-type K+ transport system membrane component KefB